MNTTTAKKISSRILTSLAAIAAVSVIFAARATDAKGALAAAESDPEQRVAVSSLK